MRVLLVIDSAPDYRETFLRSLGSVVDLDVFGRRCDEVGLVPPDVREGYRYRDVAVTQIGPLAFQPQLNGALASGGWDLVCCDLNLRYPSRIGLYRQARREGIPFVWRGQVFGNNDNAVILALKKRLLGGADGILVYSLPIADRVREQFGLEAVSYNNTEVSAAEFREGVFRPSSELKVLFVGRYQKRKHLERLLSAVERNSWLSARFIGPGMEVLRERTSPAMAERATMEGYLVGAELNAHFDWADIVVSPGHVGLLVMNAARHGKGIVIDSGSTHAPEYFLAQQAGQPFVDFSSPPVVDGFLHALWNDRKRVQELGRDLQAVARREYTVEYMTSRHLEVFKSAAGI